MIAYGENIQVFCGNSNPQFAQTICKELGVPMGKAIVTHFADGEASVTLEETVRGADVFLIQSTCKPVNDNLMELLIMIDACRRASAGRITAFSPSFLPPALFIAIPNAPSSLSSKSRITDSSKKSPVCEGEAIRKLHEMSS